MLFLLAYDVMLDELALLRLPGYPCLFFSYCYLTGVSSFEDSCEDNLELELGGGLTSNLVVLARGVFYFTGSSGIS